MEIKKVSINSVNLNPENPRVIKDFKFNKLVKSIREFPEMLKIRPIVVNKDNVILGGNMRFRASVEAGLKEVYIIKAKDLNEKQQKEFIVKDNVGFGEWDWDILANHWDTSELKDWGLDIPKWEDKEEFDSDVEDTGAYDFPEDEIEASHVKMVQLFLTTDTEPKFREMELALRDLYNSDNMTDTIYNIVQEAYDRNKT